MRFYFALACIVFLSSAHAAPKMRTDKARYVGTWSVTRKSEPNWTTAPIEEVLVLRADNRYVYRRASDKADNWGHTPLRSWSEGRWTVKNDVAILTSFPDKARSYPSSRGRAQISRGGKTMKFQFSVVLQVPVYNGRKRTDRAEEIKFPATVFRKGAPTPVVFAA